MATTQTALVKIAKRIQKNNDEFAKMSKAEKRVQIAKDVIAMIKSQVITIENMVWLDADVPTDCKACALGSMLAAKALRETRLQDDQEAAEFETVRDWSFVFYELSKLFSDKQLKLIELAFELGDGIEEPFSIKEEKICDYYARYKSRNRAVHIMRNIIDNNGTFKPSVEVNP